ncbi:MAG: hypothetical protein WC069_03180 [Candidatus Shapirobacteria bacterium]
MSSNFSKIHKSLDGVRYFSTVWCTLDPSVIPYLQTILKPVLQYCNWLSVFGDSKVDSKFLPHITLRYLGFTDELDKNKIINDKSKFSTIINSQTIKSLTLGKISIWEKIVDSKIVTARLNWQIIDSSVLKSLHNSLLAVEGYQFFEDLESNNFSAHISLGDINLNNDNLAKVKEYLSIQNFINQKVNLSHFAINYATPNNREEILL